MAGARATYGARAVQAQCALGRALLGLMERKRTNLCVAVDVTSSAELIRLARVLGPYICVLKVCEGTAGALGARHTWLAD
jgi:orotidine-5'-phosphate decarboxylase